MGHDVNIPCPSEAWDDFIRDMDEQAEIEAGVWLVCEKHGESYPLTHGCASCLHEEMEREAALAEEMEFARFAVMSDATHDNHFWM